MGESFIVRRGGESPELVIETGLIVGFYGLDISIPAGWALCDGTNSTPDLRNRFIIGAGDTYAVEATGGFADSIVVNHTHDLIVETSGDHSHLFKGSGSYGTSDTIKTISNGRDDRLGKTSGSNSFIHSHTGTINSTGESSTNANLPPYYSLYYIIKLEEA